MSSWRHAFSLSKAEVAAATPPGTSVLIEHHITRTKSGHHDEAHDELVLIPQPSADPADPLNFPKWRKIAALVCCCLYAVATNWASASIASAFPFLAAPGVFRPAPMPFAKLGKLIAVNVLMLGASNIWWVPLANVFGRRTIMLVGLLTLTLCSMWAGLVRNDYWNLLAARLFMGIGGGPADTICPEIIGELFFVHETGRAMVFYAAALALGSLFGALSGGYIAADLGFAWLNWVNVILSASTLALTFFLVPETLYDRVTSTPAAMQNETSTEEAANFKDGATQIERKQVAEETQYRSYSYGRSLKVGTYRGGVSKQIIALAKPLLLPGVWMIAFWHAGLVGGVVTISTVGPTLVAVPPYLWRRNVGLINIGSIIGATLAILYTYVSSDWILKRAARRNKQGFGEPESRLWTALPGLILATFGLIMFGFCGDHPGGKMWVGLQVGSGMLSFGLVQAPSIGFNYLIESYSVLAGDCFVVVIVVRAIIAFAWTFFVSPWVSDVGTAEPFGIFGMLMGLFTIFTIVMIKYGKRTRIATAHVVGRAKHGI